MTAVVTTMFCEEKYYGSTDNEIVRLATDLCEKHPEFVSNLACFAHEVFNMCNLRNIIKSGADITPVLAVLSNPIQVKKSK